MYGEDWSYARTRLEGTIVRYKDEPVHIHSINVETGRAEVSNVETYGTEKDRPYRVDTDDLNLKPVPLGYVNLKAGVAYLSRIPMRRDWKQGLRLENCFFNSARRFSLVGKPISDCIKGIYPSFKEAFEKSKAMTTVAWHRHWAVQAGQVVLYKANEVVGSIKNGKVILDKDFHYLKECLEESL